MNDHSWMTTSTICSELELSSRTLERYRKRTPENNPFPEPDITAAGAPNKWYRHKVVAWQEAETKIKRAKPFASLHNPRSYRGRFTQRNEA
ncbi:excisionase Xis [Serratia ureilytica]|uniref:excisionase Xis n=1 Tax=Serratia ureilytica TaxID=300181 RepID=UPI0034C6C2F7